MQINPTHGGVSAWWSELVEALDRLDAEQAPASTDCGEHGGGWLAALGLPPASHSALQRGADAPTCEAASDAGAAARREEAKQLAETGGLQSPAVQPPPSQQERDALAARVNAADDDAAVRIANDARAMAIATPEQKAALLRKLKDGHTNGDEEQAIKKILLSCNSRQEIDQVVQMSGGMHEIADELDDGDLKQVMAHTERLTQRQDAACGAALSLLERAQTPEEFDSLYRQLGGEQLKHKLPQPPRSEMLRRLEALGERHGVAGVGFGMPPEKTATLQSSIQKAINEEDNAAIVQLSENGDAMKAASPAQKAQMIRVLQDGWTKDSQDMAIARILTSCASKAEFDQVVDMAGGPKILEDVDLAEAKADINKLMGGFDRLDCADDKATAQAYRGALLPPEIDELSRTRAPSATEQGAVLGAPPAGSRDDAQTRQRIDDVRMQMGAAAHDVQADPLARNKLALVNRERQINGQPPLDYTALTSRVYQVANDPAFLAEADRETAKAQKLRGTLDDADKQEIREQVLERRLGAVAKEYGLSEQEIKTLVTAKAGRVLQEGAAAVRSLSNDPATLAWADRLQATGVTTANLFKVPPSFAEVFVNALSVIGDVLAAVVNVIPGVGQAISGAYYGVKAIVGFATGDILGAFKSLLSAVPGFSGLFGAAGAAINTGAKVAQAGLAMGEGIAGGNPLAFAGAAGGFAGNLGLDLNKFVPGGELAQAAIKHGTAVGRVVDGVARGDLGAVFGAVLPQELRALGAGALAEQFEALGNSPAATAFRGHTEHVGRFVGAIGAGNILAAGESLRHWAPQLAGHSASRAIGGLAAQARDVLDSPELDLACKQGHDKVHEARCVLEQLAALRSRADDVRRLEDAAVAFGSLGASGWHTIVTDLLKRLKVF